MTNKQQLIQEYGLKAVQITLVVLAVFLINPSADAQVEAGILNPLDGGVLLRYTQDVEVGSDGWVEGSLKASFGDDLKQAFRGTPDEFQRADNAPFATRGDGVLNATDVAQMRLYIATLSEPQTAGGPTVPNPAPPPLFEGDSGAEAAYGRAMRVVAADAKAGEQVTVSIEMDTLGDETIASFTLNFDPAILGNPVVNLGKGATESTGLITNMTNLSAGEIGMLIDSDGGFGISERGQIVTVTFDVAKDARIGFTPVSFSSSLVAASMSDMDARSLAIKYENAGIFITGRDSLAWAARARAEPPFLTCKCDLVGFSLVEFDLGFN